MDLGTRDIILGLIILASLPLSVMRPFFGLLVFSWLAYMRPTDMAWNVGKFHPSMWVGVSTVLGVLINPKERFFVLEKRTILLTVFVAAVAASAFAAIDPAVAWGPDGNVVNLLKVVFIAILTTGLCSTRDRCRWLLLVIGGSLGLLALKTLVQALFNPGHTYHGPGGMIEDNNDYGLALVMALPLVFFVWREEKGPFLKVLLAFMSFACVAGVLLTRSRGGVIALFVVFLAMLFFSRKNPLALIFAPLALAVVLVLVPPQLLTRIKNLTAGVADVSATERIVAWQKALNMSADHPVLGVGPANFIEQWPNYPPVGGETAVVTHNTYLHILAESGIVTLLVFLALLAVTIVSLVRLRVRTTEPWRARYATAVLLSILGFMAGAIFLSRTHFDLFYHLIGLSVALRMASTEGQFDWFGIRSRSAAAKGGGGGGARIETA